MLPALQVGPLVLQTPGLIVIVGLWLSISLAEHYYARCRLVPAQVDNLVLGGLLCAAVGGRLTYAVQNLAAFSASPASLISLNPALWDPTGGVLLGLVFCAWYARRREMSFWRLLDGLTPALAGMAVTVGLAHLAAGSAYGAPAQLPWSLFLWGAWRHPSQVYETLGAVLVLAWVLRRFTARPSLAPGRLFLEFAAWSAALSLFLDRFRGDPAALIGTLRATQMGAWLVLAICLVLLGRMQTEPDPGSADPQTD